MSVALREEAPTAVQSPTALIGKAAQVAALVDGMRVEIHGRLDAEIAQLQANEVRTRIGLTGALMDALAWGAEAEARLRQVLASTGPLRIEGRLGRRLHWRARQVLARLGVAGQARLIEGSGFWRPGTAQGRRARIAAYLRRKADPAAQPEILFDQAWYLERYPDVRELDLSPLLHYLLVGQGERRDPHPLFSSEYYTDRYEDELALDLTWGLGHFMRSGLAAPRDPHPLFDAVHYLSQGARPDPGEDLVSHYLRAGWRQGLSPHPLFEPEWYAAQLPPSAADMPPLLHYVLEGAAAGLSPHPLFDPQWYRVQAQHAPADLLSHYLREGAAQGLSPSRWFDPAHYARRRGAALPSGANPLVDYLQVGAWRVAEPAPGFATLAYVAAHPELARQGVTPLAHWARAAAERRRAD